MARRGLGPDLIEPALRTLERCGVVPALWPPPAAPPRWKADGPASSVRGPGCDAGPGRPGGPGPPAHALTRLLPGPGPAATVRAHRQPSLPDPGWPGALRRPSGRPGSMGAVSTGHGERHHLGRPYRRGLRQPNLPPPIWPEVQRAAAFCWPSAAGRDAGLPRGQGARATISQPAGLRLRTPRRPCSN